MYLAGIDIGTTGCKCSVYDDEGNFFMEEYEEYRIHITKEEHTIDAEVVWEGIKSVIKKNYQTNTIDRSNLCNVFWRSECFTRQRWNCFG